MGQAAAHLIQGPSEPKLTHTRNKHKTCQVQPYTILMTTVITVYLGAFIGL